eukprot:scaffold19518_cov112-Isochrysis_galbana.AAC.2
MAAAVGAAAASRPGGRSSSISILMMSPVQTPRCALCPPALPGSAPAFPCLPARVQATDPEPATP